MAMMAILRTEEKGSEKVREGKRRGTA